MAAGETANANTPTIVQLQNARERNRPPTGYHPPSEDVEFLDLHWPDFAPTNGGTDAGDTRSLYLTWLKSAPAAFRDATARLDQKDDSSSIKRPRVVRPTTALRLFKESKARSSP